MFGKGRRLRFLVAGLAVLGLLVLAALVFAGPLVRTAVAAAGRAAGYRVSYGELRAGGGHLTILAPDVASLGGEPIFTAERIDADYDLRAVVRGPYFYGISGVEIDRPEITLVHHKDGTYNVNFPHNGGNSSSQVPSVPQIHAIVRDGSLHIVDGTRIYAHSRHIAIEGVHLDADLHPGGRSVFTLALAIVEDGGTYPFAGRGTFDESRGYELARVTAHTVALGPLIDYALNSATLHVAGGVLNDVDARIYGLPAAGGTMARHLSVTANLDHFQPYLGGIAKPLRDGRGALRVYDDGLAIPKVDGSIAGIPVRISGAIYDLASPKLRLGIAGRGDVRRLLTLSDAAEKLPLTGPLAFTLLVEGDATLPTTFLRFSSPGLHYDAIPLDHPSGYVALRGQDAALLRSDVGYDGIGVGARGNITLAKHTATDLFANVLAPAQRVPYAAALLGAMNVRGNAVTTGTDADLETSGVIDGTTSDAQLAGTFDVAGNGEGTIGPISLDGPGARGFFARVALDRPHAGGGAAYIWTRGLRLSTMGAQPALPGIALAALPPADLTLDGAGAGALDGRRYTFGGSAHAYDGHAYGYPLGDVTARARVVAGPRIAIDARYRGELAPLAAASGGRFRASGSVDIPVSVRADGVTNALAQISGARFDDAEVAGIRLDGLDATIGMRGTAIDVYAARARLDGNDIVARGSAGTGGTLEVSAGNVDLAELRAAGVPVRAGSLTAVASIGGTSNAPTMNAGVTARNVTLQNPAAAGFTLDANTDLAYADGALRVENALVRAGPAVAAIDGSVRGLRGDPASAAYDFNASVRQADIGALARAAKAPIAYPEGSLDANVRVRGSGANPRIAGTISIPEGSVNGLRFRDARVALTGTPRDLSTHGGHVIVGTSQLAISAAASSSGQTVRLRAPSVDLADLNDYFDAGDTLGGRGSIDADVRNAPNRITTSGRVRLAHTRFHSFDLGETRADWSTSGRRIDANVALGSSAGQLRATGSLTLPATAPVRDTFGRSTLALDAHARGIDLATWLPAAGVIAPVFGKVDADATASGTYPNVALDANAGLTNGKVRDVPIRIGTLALRAGDGRVTITHAEVAIDNASATASGYAGIRRGAPFDLRVVAQSADIGALAKTLTGRTLDASGSFTNTLRASGTQQRPSVADTFDASDVRYQRTTIPHVHVAAGATTTRLTLQTAEIDLAKGRLLASGTTPIVMQPAFGIPDGAPLDLSLTADRIDVAQFATLLPKGSELAGTLDGTVGLTGTRATPGLRGDLALRDAAFSGPQLRSRLSGASVELAFANRTAVLRNAGGTIGGGRLSASGSITVPDLQGPIASATASLALTSNGALIDAPQYLKGRINGTVTFARAAGEPAKVGGTLAFTSTRIPTTVLVTGSGPSASSTAPAFPVAFDLGVDVGDDVRVQGGPVDIGAKGHLQVGGTLAAPTVDGTLTSTGGTLSFYRTFQIQFPTTVTFDPADGVIPNVDALATTNVDDPPTQVNLHVTGPATQLNVALASDPDYSREQILGLLVGAQALGAVSGVATANGGGPQQNPFQALAEGQLGTLLAQNVLEPFSSQLGSAVGLNNLAINYTPGAGASIGAQKKLIKDVTAVFAQSFGEYPRESVGLIASPSTSTAVQLTFFSQPSANQFNIFQGANNLQSNNQSVTDSQPANGSSGFSVSVQKKF